ncbi:PEPxxWA-CTERM sorting domain-containing protein [Sphingomonas sp. 1P06PA]|uniref:PEPxxWA-CTERM sorting domain-containing protein n=1 Tax=Sphingomonas sp. 1P06PA TaxID=554121 RepID=UPI0039A50F1A
MRTIFILAAAAAAAALSAPAAAITVWEGTSVGVPDEETGELEYYTVRFEFDDSAPLFVTPLTAQDPENTPFTRALYQNITSFSVTGADGTIGFSTGNSFVSTLAPNLAQFGSVPFLVLAGTDGITAPGYQLQFSYTPAAAYTDTSMPDSLDIGAPGTDAGFNLLSYYYEGDPADEIIGGPDTILNFRFASGGFLPAAAVPEPASWALMIGGFGLIGGTLRTRRMRPTAA